MLHWLERIEVIALTARGVRCKLWLRGAPLMTPKYYIFSA